MSVNIKFTKEQYKALFKMAFLGNWVSNAHRTEDFNEDIEKLKNYIYSFAKEAGLESWTMEIKALGSIEASKDKTQEILNFIDEYDEHVFWEELGLRLATTEMVKKYGHDKMNSMSREERLNEKLTLSEEYSTEFTENGLMNLKIVKE